MQLASTLLAVRKDIMLICSGHQLQKTLSISH